MPIEIINSKDAAHNFFNWLADHPEIERINGYTVDRLDNGRPSRFCFGSLYHTFDADYIWAERKTLNDWIRAYNANEAAGSWARLPDTSVVYMVEYYQAAGSGWPHSSKLAHEIELIHLHPDVASLVLNCKASDHFFLKVQADTTEIAITKIS